MKTTVCNYVHYFLMPSEACPKIKSYGYEYMKMIPCLEPYTTSY